MNRKKPLTAAGLQVLLRPPWLRYNPAACMPRCLLFLTASLAIACACGCAAQSNRVSALPPHISYVDRSREQAKSLTSEEAKAVLMALAAGGNQNPWGGYWDIGKAVFDIHRADDGWYVFCHGQDSLYGNTVFVSSDWEVTNVVYGPRPLDISTSSRGPMGAHPVIEQRPEQLVGNERIYSHAIWAESPLKQSEGSLKPAEGSLKQLKGLPPDAAKAILIARGAGVDLIGGGSGYGAQAYEAIVYEVFRVRGGWFVFCHGGLAGRTGQTVRIDDSWNVVQHIWGPPFANTPAATTKP